MALSAQHIYSAFFDRLVRTPEGRAHVLNLIVNAEEGDEHGVFERLQDIVEDPRARKAIARHQADEQRHAQLYRDCLQRNGVIPRPIPEHLMVIRRVAATAGGSFAEGQAAGNAGGLATREDIMNTYALLLAIEARGVQQFPLIGAAFRRLGDHATADTFDRVTRDEARHVRYCHAIGRMHAVDDRAWARAVRSHKLIEAQAFRQAGLAGVAYAIEHGYLWGGSAAARAFARLLNRLDPLLRSTPSTT